MELVLSPLPHEAALSPLPSAKSIQDTAVQQEQPLGSTTGTACTGSSAYHDRSSLEWLTYTSYVSFSSTIFATATIYQPQLKSILYIYSQY